MIPTNDTVREERKAVLFNGYQLTIIGVLTFCSVISLTFLLICTKSSPLYPLNDWVDANTFFSMGKGMMNGKIIYRDLFEQKGPLLYFIHGLSYLLSNTSFLGVFIFEVIAFSAFLYYCHKTICLFLDIKYSIISLPIIAAITLNMKSFFNGDSAEEFCIPLVAVSLYYMLMYFNNVYPKPMCRRWLLINGFIAGCVLWIKFSLLGFWIGWIFSTSINSFLNKQYIYLIRGWLEFVCGMFVATLPWIVYFGINDAVVDWLYTYLYINTVYYSVQLPFLGRLIFVLVEGVRGLALNPLFGVLFIIGVLAFIRDDGFIKDLRNRIGLLLCILLLFMGTYGGGTGYLYYFVIFAPLIVFGFVQIMNILSSKYNNVISLKNAVSVALIIILITLPITFEFNQNAYLLKTDKQELFQYQFADRMNKTGGRTLLNYGSWDLGLYTVSNITPNVRFFFKPNIEYSRFPLIMDEQNKYIKDKRTDYIVMVQPASENPYDLNIPYLYTNYRLVMQCDSQMDISKYALGNMMDVKYLLFEVKS